MTAHNPETVCHRNTFPMRMTSYAGGASGEPHEAGKMRISQRPGHGISAETDRKTGYPTAEGKAQGKEKTAFSIGRSQRGA